MSQIKRKKPMTRRGGVWTESVVKAIDATWHERYIPPSMRDIMNATGITSKCVVTYEYERLAEQGVIEIVDGKPVPKWVIAKLSK